MQRILIASLLLLPFALGQTPSDTAEDLRYLLSWPPPDRISGRNIKVLWFAGDQTAVEMRKMYGNDFLVQPFILRSVLRILEISFEKLDWVVHPEDREPRASISLLRSLRRTVEDKRYETAIDELIAKLTAPETIGTDFGCIDALALSVIPIGSRKQAPDLLLRDLAAYPSSYPLTRVG
jgi:hypothetical protein